MDMQLRYWNDGDGLVKTQFYDSQFITRPNAKNLASSLGEILKGIPLQKMHHLSMDRPSVNWNVLDSLNYEGSENKFPSLINTGSCGLHVVHGARAVTIWSNVVTVIQHFLSLTQTKKPKKYNPYDTLMKYHIDSLMLVTIQFFKDIGSALQTYLTQFQSDASLVPFINDGMVQLLTKIMRFFIKRNVLEEASSDYKLINIALQRTKQNGKCSHKIVYSHQQFTSEDQPLQREKNKISGLLCCHIYEHYIKTART